MVRKKRQLNRKNRNIVSALQTSSSILFSIYLTNLSSEMIPECCACKQTLNATDISVNGSSVDYNLERSDTNAYQHLGIMRRNTGRPRVTCPSEVVGMCFFYVADIVDASDESNVSFSNKVKSLFMVFRA